MILAPSPNPLLKEGATVRRGFAPYSPFLKEWVKEQGLHFF